MSPVAAVPLSGRVVDVNRAPVRGLPLRLSLLTPDENVVALDSQATTDGEGRFQCALTGDVLSQLFTGGAGLLFRSGDGNPGSVNTPLHLRDGHTTAVVLVQRGTSLEVES